MCLGLLCYDRSVTFFEVKVRLLLQIFLKKEARFKSFRCLFMGFQVSQWNLSLTNYHLLRFGVMLKKNIHITWKILLKYFLPFLTTYLCEVKFSSQTSTKIPHCNQLNAEASKIIQLSFIKLYIKVIYKNVKQYHSSPYDYI